MRCPEYGLIEGLCKSLLLFENENGFAAWMKQCVNDKCRACKGNIGDDIKNFLPESDINELKNGKEIRIVARIESVEVLNACL